MKKIAIFAFAGLLLVAGVIYFGFYQHSGPFVPPKGTVLLRVSKETTIVRSRSRPRVSIDNIQLPIPQPFSADNNVHFGCIRIAISHWNH